MDEDDVDCGLWILVYACNLEALDLVEGGFSALYKGMWSAWSLASEISMIAYSSYLSYLYSGLHEHNRPLESVGSISKDEMEREAYHTCAHRLAAMQHSIDGFNISWVFSLYISTSL